MADRNTPKPEPNTRLPRPDLSNPEDFLVLLLRAVKSLEKEIQEVQKEIQDAQKLAQSYKIDAFFKFSELKCALETLTTKDKIGPLSALPKEDQQKEFLNLLGNLDEQHKRVENSLKTLSRDKDVNKPVGGCSTEPPRERELPQSIPLPELRKASAPGHGFDSSTPAGQAATRHGKVETRAYL